MGKSNLFEYIKELIGIISWRLFLWSIDMTQEQYRLSIYEQEEKFSRQNREEK